MNYTLTITQTEEVTDWTKRSYGQIATDDKGKAKYGYPEQVPEKTIRITELVKLRLTELDIKALIKQALS